MHFKITFILIIYFCEIKIVQNSIPSTTPYLFDEKMEQSVVYKSMDNSENEFEYEIADLLGLSDRPRRIKKPLSLRKAASKFLLELYNSLKEKEEPHLSGYHNRVTRSTLITRNDRTKIERSNNIVTFSSKKRKSPRKHGSNMIITFNTNHVSHDLQLLRAELRLFQNSKLGRQFNVEKNITISVLRRILNQKMQRIDLKLVSSITTTTSYKGWLETNVTAIMSKWLLKGYSPSGHDLIISTRVTGISNDVLPKHEEEFVTPEDIGLINESGSDEHQPFIIGYFNGPELLNKIQHLRFKRGIEKKRYSPEYFGSQADGESYRMPMTCERMNFSIDFKDLQMHDWVIAPKKFEAYFCGGECNFPLGSKMNATNHAIVQTLMHLKQPNLPKPCCVPTVLGSISILHYLNEDSVNLSKYPNSVAKSCGCH